MQDQPLLIEDIVGFKIGTWVEEKDQANKPAEGGVVNKQRRAFHITGEWSKIYIGSDNNDLFRLF